MATLRGEAMARTRGKGEGSVFKNEARGVWEAIIELPPGANGQRRRKVRRRKTKAEALTELDVMRRQLERSGDLPTAAMTVDQWAEYWMREVAVKTRRPKTIQSYRSVLRQHVLPTLGRSRLDKVTPAAIRKALSTMEAGGLAPTSRRNAHSIMAAMFKDAEREGRIPRSPVELVQAPRKGVAQLETLNVAGVRRLLEAFAESPDGYLWATYLLTGARRGEILGMEWDRVGDALDLSWQLQRISWEHGCGGVCGKKRAGDCPQRRTDDVPDDFEYRHIKGGLYWTRPKSRAGWREIPLVHPLAGILEQWRAIAPTNEWGLVFTRTDRWGKQIPLDPDFITDAWREFTQAHQLGDVRLHDVRHTTVDLLYAADVSEPDIMAIVGHSTVTMSRSYKSPASRERLAGAMRQLSGSLGYSG